MAGETKGQFNKAELASDTKVRGAAAIPSLERTSLEEVARSAFVEVLGAYIQPQNVQAFQRALMQRFERKEVEGRIEYKWKPGATVVETLLGVVKLTGKQARLYERAQSCLKDAQVNLDKMAPLCPDADMDLVRARKTIVLDLVNNIVSEFGREQEPRENFVEKLFQILLVEDGELAALEDALCYNKAEIVYLDDEEQRTYGAMLRDNIEALHTAWKKYYTEAVEPYKPPQPPVLDLGRLLRALSRNLAAVAESVREVQAALTSVSFGPTEQKTVSYEFEVDGKKYDLTIDDLLSMVELSATVKAPKLVQEGGRHGVKALLPLAQELDALVKNVIDAKDPFDEYPFDEDSVKRAFSRFHGDLEEVLETAEEVVGEVSIEQAASSK